MEIAKINEHEKLEEFVFQLKRVRKEAEQVNKEIKEFIDKKENTIKENHRKAWSIAENYLLEKGLLPEDFNREKYVLEQDTTSGKIILLTREEFNKARFFESLPEALKERVAKNGDKVHLETLKMD